MKREDKRKVAKELRIMLDKAGHADQYNHRLSVLGDATFDHLVGKGVQMDKDDEVMKALQVEGISAQAAKLYIEWLKEAYSE